MVSENVGAVERTLITIGSTAAFAVRNRAAPAKAAAVKPFILINGPRYRNEGCLGPELC